MEWLSAQTMRRPPVAMLVQRQSISAERRSYAFSCGALADGRRRRSLLFICMFGDCLYDCAAIMYGVNLSF